MLAFQYAKAGPLFDEEEGGTPQRFAWALAETTTIPDEGPEWPKALDWVRPD